MNDFPEVILSLTAGMARIVLEVRRKAFSQFKVFHVQKEEDSMPHEVIIARGGFCRLTYPNMIPG